jgi:hypothetical protein
MRIVAVVAFVIVLLAGAPVAAQPAGTAADFRSDEDTTDPVLRSEVTHVVTLNTAAIVGIATPQPYYGIGGEFSGGWIGARGFAALPGASSRYGVVGSGSGGENENVGLWGSGEGPSSSLTAVGVYGIANCDGPPCVPYAGYFEGDLLFTGNIIGPPSDLMFKDNIDELETALATLLALEVVTYEHKQLPEFEKMYLPEGPQVGFMAQQVAEVAPELVVDAVHPDSERSPDGADQLDPGLSEAVREPIRFKAITMMKMIPLLVRAIQEQQAEIEELRAEIAPLRTRLAELEGKAEIGNRVASAAYGLD